MDLMFAVFPPWRCLLLPVLLSALPALVSTESAAASFSKEDREVRPYLLGSESLLADVPRDFAGDYRLLPLTEPILERFQPPRLVTAARPSYPEEKVGSGETGQAQVEFVIDETGHFGVVVRIQASDPAFAVSAYEALLQFEFEPARLDDEPIALITSQRFTFADPAGSE